MVFSPELWMLKQYWHLLLCCVWNALRLSKLEYRIKIMQHGARQFIQLAVYKLLILSQYGRIMRDATWILQPRSALFHVHTSFPFCVFFLIFLWLNFLMLLLKISFLEIMSSCCAEVNCFSPFPRPCVSDNSLLSVRAFFIKIRACILLSKCLLLLCLFSAAGLWTVFTLGGVGSKATPQLDQCSPLANQSLLLLLVLANLTDAADTPNPYRQAIMSFKNTQGLCLTGPGEMISN